MIFSNPGLSHYAPTFSGVQELPTSLPQYGASALCSL